MEKFLAEIDIMPKEDLLDPQGKLVNEALHSMNLKSIRNLRMGKHIRFIVECEREEEVEEIIKIACRKLLVNPVVEEFKFRILSIKE